VNGDSLDLTATIFRIFGIDSAGITPRRVLG